MGTENDEILRLVLLAPPHQVIPHLLGELGFDGEKITKEHLDTPLSDLLELIKRQCDLPGCPAGALKYWLGPLGERHGEQVIIVIGRNTAELEKHRRLRFREEEIKDWRKLSGKLESKADEISSYLGNEARVSQALKLIRESTGRLMSTHLKDPEWLAQRLKNSSEDGKPQFLKDLPTYLSNELDDWRGETPVPNSLRKALLKWLNELIKGDAIWDPEAFRQANPSLGRMAAENPKGEALRQLNRLLLGHYFADVLARQQTPEERLCVALNVFVEKRPLHKALPFTKLRLRPITRQSLDQAFGDRITPLLNRLLLEDAYPEEVSPTDLWSDPFLMKPVGDTCLRDYLAEDKRPQDSEGGYDRRVREIKDWHQCVEVLKLIPPACHLQPEAISHLKDSYFERFWGWFRARGSEAHDCDQLSNDLLDEVLQNLASFDPGRGSFDQFWRILAKKVLSRSKAGHANRPDEKDSQDRDDSHKSLKEEENQESGEKGELDGDGGGEEIEGEERGDDDDDDDDDAKRGDGGDDGDEQTALNAARFGLMMEEAFSGSSPPHQLIVIGLVAISQGKAKPREIVARYSDTEFRELWHFIRTTFLDQAVLSGEECQRVFAQLDRIMEERLTLGDVLNGKGPYGALKALEVGKTKLSDYYISDKGQHISEWKKSVERAVDNAFKKYCLTFELIAYGYFSLARMPDWVVLQKSDFTFDILLSELMCKLEPKIPEFPTCLMRCYRKALIDIECGLRFWETDIDPKRFNRYPDLKDMLIATTTLRRCYRTRKQPDNPGYLGNCVRDMAEWREEVRKRHSSENRPKC